MSNKMLIDATHPEETRVVVVRDKRVEDFDFEAASRKPLRGNIYLAKVTRVEPSLQAAFVDFGGNRHGFLPFSEIHPDYYQIPQADRAALLEEERAAQAEADEAPPEKPKRRRRAKGASSRNGRNGDKGESRAAASDTAAGEGDRDEADTAPDAAGEETGAADAPDTPAASVQSTGEADALAPSDVAATADAREREVAETAAQAPSALGRAVEQASETVESEVEAADNAPRGEAEQAPQPHRADEATAEAATTPEDADRPDTAAGHTEAADSGVAGAQDNAEDTPDAGEADEAGPARKPARTRRSRTRRTADGLADPQVSDDEDADDEQTGEDEDNGASVATFGSSDAMEEIPERRRATPKRQYKIQEVIKRRQILLVQVVKEERGTKGAALTTYLSLAGRYSVLMPNTDRGGGISRKITDSTDRKRLKEVVSDLEVPEGMTIILRTAGASRTKAEIRRDFDYLLRLWENVRELTLKSIAPQLVYEEGNLVKRAIRDLYSKEIDEVLVAGESAYREAKDFMRMLMPSHAKNVKPYREPTPIFTAYAVEPQLDAMFSPQVTLPSKGYVVINPTEALVAIDVNSGKSTKESSIEETALKTNLEAADEVARQLRLRDLAGLIVIDFIDMDEKRHNRAVEKRLKDALKLDRSRIQVGRISPFGLLEMSRQRIRQGMVESSMIPCPTCAGTGQVRSTPSVALHCLRALEEHLLKHADRHVTIKTSSAVALYILNQKRPHLSGLEERFGLNIGVDADEHLSGQHMEIVPGAPVERAPEDAVPTTQLSPDAVLADGSEDEDETEDEESAAEARGDETGSGDRGARRKRRRRRRNGGEEARANEAVDEAAQAGDLGEAADGADSEDDDARPGETEEERRSRRRRGRRGGRRHRRERGTPQRAEGEPGAADTAGTAPEVGPETAGDGAAAASGAQQDSADTAADARAASTPPPHAVHVPIETGTPEPAASDGTGRETGPETHAEPADAGPVPGAEAGAAAPDARTPAEDAGEDAAAGSHEDAEGHAGAGSEAHTAGGEPAAADQGTEEPPSPAQPAEEQKPEEQKPEEQQAQEQEQRAAESRPRRVGWWQRRSFF